MKDEELEKKELEFFISSVKGVWNKNNIFTTDLVLEGYYQYGVFWKEDSYLNRLPDNIEKIYKDIPTNELYYYGSITHTYKKLISIANDSVAGIMKLYSNTGDNVDGSITQKIITEKLKNKIEINISELSTEECLIFILNNA